MDSVFQTTLDADDTETTEITTTTASSRLSLEALGRMISASLTKSDNYRITAGKYLVEARERVEAGEAGNDIKWEAWCAENVKRSYRDVQRLIAFAKTDDPEAALAKSNETTAVAMRKSRTKVKEKATNVSHPPAQSDLRVPESPEDKLSDDIGSESTTGVSGGIVSAHPATASADVQSDVGQRPSLSLPPVVTEALTKTPHGTPMPELRAKLEHIRRESYRLMTGDAAMWEALFEAIDAEFIATSPSDPVTALVQQFNVLPTEYDQAAFRKAITASGDTWLERMTNLFKEGSLRDRIDFIDSHPRRRKRGRARPAVGWRAELADGP